MGKKKMRWGGGGGWQKNETKNLLNGRGHAKENNQTCNSNRWPAAIESTVFTLSSVSGIGLSEEKNGGGGLKIAIKSSLRQLTD